MTITTHWKSIALLCIGTPVVCYSICILLNLTIGHRTASCSSKAADYSEDEATKSPYDQAMFFKNRGNKFFKASRYEQAIECYTNALKCCPEEAVNERATFYQNRAAANENLKNFEAALSDINSALELSPKYLKALNRRAHLFEKLDRLQECLLDVTACCIFEQFRNAENVLCVDRVLKRLGQQKAKEERPNLPRELPSTLFIQNYLG
ncbi:unnamed protein product [Protopolystoma xenopodis]|uniref:Uncharacterized protein n=1 Tax=Protopolystoma xenopodis TaxID=117903 RepID=A0A448WZT8_9PLAT|nr:unnamed protein product [Protopolystoma xenopodis]